LRHATVWRVAEPSTGLAGVLILGLGLPKASRRSDSLLNGYDAGGLKIAN
jgi:hypothetical protein